MSKNGYRVPQEAQARTPLEDPITRALSRNLDFTREASNILVPGVDSGDVVALHGEEAGERLPGLVTEAGDHPVWRYILEA